MSKYNGIVKLPTKEIGISSDDGLRWKLDGVLPKHQVDQLLKALRLAYPTLQPSKPIIFTIYPQM